MVVLVESPFNPKVMICDCCAARAARYTEDARMAPPGITDHPPDDRENTSGGAPTQ